MCFEGGATIPFEPTSRRILITGSNGFIGSRLHKILRQAEGLSRTRSETTNIVGDILTPPIVTSNYDVIYHLAAEVGTETGMQNPICTYRTNICGTIDLIESFKGLFIFLSTVGTYYPLRNPYFLSKYVCEEIVRASPCKHIIFRIANPYGQGSKSVIQKWLKAKRIKIYGDGNQARDFCYIDDVIDIIGNPWKLKLNKTYNIGTGVPTTLNRLIEEIVTLTGKKTIEYLPRREFEIREPITKPDIVCKTTLKDGLKKSLEERRIT